MNNLIERLRRKYAPDFELRHGLVNPDGPEAADALEEALKVTAWLANERLSMEPGISDAMLRSAGEEMRRRADALDARDNAIRAARDFVGRWK